MNEKFDSKTISKKLLSSNLGTSLFVVFVLSLFALTDTTFSDFCQQYGFAVALALHCAIYVTIAVVSVPIAYIAIRVFIYLFGIKFKSQSCDEAQRDVAGEINDMDNTRGQKAVE